jgi:hypothetical protein
MKFQQMLASSENLTQSIPASVTQLVATEIQMLQTLHAT